MVYICVLNYKNPYITIECLNSLLQLQDVRYRIILVDNASPDDSVSVLQKYIIEHSDAGQIIFFPLKKNLGYAGGNNVGLRYALQQNDMEYCWILNNDTVVDSYALLNAIRHMKKNPKIGLCGSKLIYDWDRTKIQGYGGFYRKWLALSIPCRDVTCIQDIDYVIGAAVLVSRSFLKEIGLMCEDYFLYFEEIDWATRAKGKFELSCAVDSIAYHKEGASIGADSIADGKRSALSDYYSIRNKLLFTRRYHPICLITVYMSLFVSIYRRFCRREYDRMKFIFKLMLGFRDSRYEKNDI